MDFNIIYALIFNNGEFARLVTLQPKPFGLVQIHI